MQVQARHMAQHHTVQASHQTDPIRTTHNRSGYQELTPQVTVEVHGKVHSVGVEDTLAQRSVEVPVRFEKVPAAEMPWARNVAAQRLQSVVVVRNGDGMGSGYSINIAPLLREMAPFASIPEGYTFIMTNRHVIMEGKGKRAKPADDVELELISGGKTKAKVVGIDKETDAALLMVPTKRQLPPIPLGDTDNLQAGESVLILGHPAGLTWSVARGIISHPRRKLPGATVEVIQTDGAINPGNSGGPMLNAKGEVIGTNSFKFADRVIDNLGFAYKVDDQLERVVRDFVERKWGSQLAAA